MTIPLTAASANGTLAVPFAVSDPMGKSASIAPSSNLTFIDLFAGIGGMRLAFESAGAQCVFSSEWNKFAAETYEANFGERPEGDITKIKSSEIPDHNILVGGFPCQPFSISGVSKKGSLGLPHGFKDKTQGTLFFEIQRIIDEKRPDAFLLENVKNLAHHDGGNTFRTIRGVLENDLGYDLHFSILNAKGLVPQNRERIFMVGFREPRDFEFPTVQDTGKRLKHILERRPSDRYNLTTHLWTYLKNYAAKHKAAGHGFGFGLAELDGFTRTLSARYFKDGSEILVPRGRKNPRRLMPRECARLMGFPESFKIPVSDTQAYKQFGNSVVVPLVELVAANIVKTLKQPTVQKRGQMRLPTAV